MLLGEKNKENTYFLLSNYFLIIVNSRILKKSDSELVDLFVFLYLTARPKETSDFFGGLLCLGKKQIISVADD